MNTKDDRRRLCLAVSALPSLIFFLTACSPEGHESPTAKHEWSILQSVEYTSRSKPIPEPELVTVQEYELLCLPAHNEGRIWIMLKPTSTPYYKQMPEGQYSIQKSLVDALVREHRVSETVADVLRSHETN